MNYSATSGLADPLNCSVDRWYISDPPQSQTKTDDFSLVESLVPTEVAVGASVAFSYPMPPILLTYRGAKTGRVIRQELNA